MLALTPRTIVLIIFFTMLAAIIGAWIYESMGYIPCELCLLQRWPYYIIVPLSLLIYVLSGRYPQLLKPGLSLLAILLLISAGLGIYHAGVELKWWTGPSSCTGTRTLSAIPDLTQKIVLCDQVSLRVFGMSLAVWNALISLGLALLATWGVRQIKTKTA